MFKPREAFLTIEHFADHIADVIASEFRTTKHKLEADLSLLKDETEEKINLLRGDLESLGLRLESAFKQELDNIRAEVVDLRSRITSAEKALTAPKTPAESQAKSSSAGSPQPVTEGQ